MRASRSLPAILLLFGCGDQAVEEPQPAPAQLLRPLHTERGADRTEHARRLLRAVDEDGRVAPFRFLGRELTPAGATALVLGPGLWTAPDRPEVGRALAWLIATVREEEDLPVLDAALALRAILTARSSHSPPIRRSRTGFAAAAAKLGRRLAKAQRDDGTWGHPVETAWAVLALQSGAHIDWLVERIGSEWRERALLSVDRLRPPGSPLPGSEIERIHLVAFVAVLRGFGAHRKPDPADERLVRRLLSGMPVEGSPDLDVAHALAWTTLGPSRDRHHPARPAMVRFREGYENRELRPRDFGEETALVTALEWFGYDSFGAAMGYLPGNGTWSAPDGE